MTALRARHGSLTVQAAGLYLCLNPREHDVWLRWRGGYGLGLRDHRRLRPLFSERNGISRNRHLHIGPWCLVLLRPLPTR